MNIIIKNKKKEVMIFLKITFKKQTYMQDIALSLTSWSMSAAFNLIKVHSYNCGTNGPNWNEVGWSGKKELRNQNTNHNIKKLYTKIHYEIYKF